MFFRKKRKPSDESRADGNGSTTGTYPKGETGGGRALEPAEGTASSQGPPSTQFLTGEAGKDRKLVQVLLEAIAQVSEVRDLDTLLTYIVDTSVEITNAERGFLLMKAEGSENLVVRVGRGRNKEDVDDDGRFSTSIPKKVLAEVQAIRATVHSESEALELGRSVFDLKLRAVMCVPLTSGMAAGGPPMGVLYVDSRAATRQFKQADLSLFAALGQQISIAIENARLHLDSIEKVRMERDLELASAIQRDLMPRIPENVPGWEVHGWYGPAEGTAGDFYDFVKAKDGRLFVIVGDVTGHGIGPALITASAQASMRSYLRMVSDPEEVVSLLNQDLCERVEDGRFLTLFVAALSEDGGLIGLNAGHSLPMIWRAATGEVELIGRGGPAVGMIPDEAYKAHPPEQLQPGDVLLIYTDGVTEARNPAEKDILFGEDGLSKALATAAASGMEAKGICLDLVEKTLAFAHNVREDDLTIVVVRRK
ncbi:MAG: sigma-B regulation protein RsbU (phosphoserine phosphatase) [Planctomycetota bacterium]|jgi:sigma-B regulation protein RsbU (phosphoserine phosphatase)